MNYVLKLVHQWEVLVNFKDATLYCVLKLAHKWEVLAKFKNGITTNCCLNIPRKWEVHVMLMKYCTSSTQGIKNQKPIGRAQRKGACCLTSAALARNASVIYFIFFLLLNLFAYFTHTVTYIHSILTHSNTQ